MKRYRAKLAGKRANAAHHLQMRGVVVEEAGASDSKRF